MNTAHKSFEIKVRTFTQHLDSSSIFANTQPVWLEIGFGVGKFLLEMCRMFPCINFIGLENDGLRHKNMLDKLYKRSISNVRILYGNAALSVKYLFSPESVEAVFINFPDPWPKDRHEKNRLFTAEFACSLASIVSPRGHVRIITDVLSYAEHIEMLMIGSRAFKKSECFEPPIQFPTTTFQDRFIEESIPFYPAVFRKVEYAEP